MAISFSKKDSIIKIFKKDKVIIGMIHTKPFPGSPRYDGESMESIIEYSLNDAKILLENGVDGLMFENHGDIPFLKPEDVGFETVACLTAIAQNVIKEFPCPFGFNVLANAPIQALAAAKATGANWVRCNQWANAYVSNEGIMDGAAGKSLRYRTQIHAQDVAIMTDVHVKHGSHAIVADRSIEELARDSVFFDADILIATGKRTGDPANVQEIQKIKYGHDLPILVGSGMTAENASEILPHINGVIVGSSIKKDCVWWNPVDPERTKIFVDAIEKLRV